MPSIAALDRRCFLPPQADRATPQRAFLPGRVPLRPQVIRAAPAPKTLPAA